MIRLLTLIVCYALSLDAEPLRSVWRIEILSPGRKVAEPSRLIASPQGDWNPHYSPDGKWIVFESLRGTTRQNWVSRSDGSAPYQLTFLGPILAGTPRWAPDSKRVAFDARDGDIRVVAAAGGAARKITDHPDRDVLPSWSRDGRWVYFASNRTGRFEVWKVSPKGGEAIQVTRKGGHVMHESPDAKWLYYTKDGAETALWRMPTGRGVESKVADSVVYRAFGVAPRGVYFLSKTTGDGALLRYIDLESGETRTLLHLSQKLHNGFSLSGDERFLIYSRVEE
jgi:Tol biopolymer transport system component